MSQKRLTTSAGAPVPDNQNTMTAGRRGPALLQDVWFLEKLAHFDRAVIPGRRMHAKDSGAFGSFTVTNDITKYTRAKIFSEVGKKTDLFLRFSTVAGSRIGYEPNSKGEWAEQPDFSEPPLRLDDHADRWDHREDDDYYSQPRALFNLMNNEQKNILFENTARSVGGTSQEIQIRHIRNFHKADPAYGEGVAKALGLVINDVLAA